MRTSATAFRPLLVFGTRPEAIKMAPVVAECRRRAPLISPIVCLTGQHREMLRQVVDYFQISVDEQLDLMTPNQTLADLTARCLQRLDGVVQHHQPNCIVAQGDTTTTMVAALAAFYRRIPFVHVEAGLRTGNLQSPWPEELNRRVADLVTALYCAPTKQSADALLAEGVEPTAVRVTGNTVVDALLWTLDRERSNGQEWRTKHAFLGDRKMVLITGHRRESFGQGFEAICRAISDLSEAFAECSFIYPVHLNPNVQEPVRRLLGGRDNVHLIPPVSYPEFVWLMDRSLLILTDSGGVQEEAPSLRRPVVVMRDTTERPEAVAVGAARLAGTSSNKIVEEVSRLMTDRAAYESCQVDENPYGDGHAASRVVEWMLEHV